MESTNSRKEFQRAKKGIPPDRYGEWEDKGTYRHQYIQSGENEDIQQTVEVELHKSMDVLEDRNKVRPIEIQTDFRNGAIEQNSLNGTSAHTQASSISKKLLANLKLKEELAKLKAEERRDKAELLKLQFEAEIAQIDEACKVKSQHSQGLSQKLSECDKIEVLSQSSMDKVDSWISNNFEDVKDPSRNLQKVTQSLATEPRTCELAPMDSNIPKIKTIEETTNGFFKNMVPQTSYSTTSLTSQQREWRKTIGKDLPKFDGDPEDWPEFVNRYRMSTTKCNFDEEENMSRLRMSLKGKAKEAVKALMLTSNNSALVMETLERKFGRRDNIIKKLLEQARTTSPIKDCEFDSLIAFSDAIRNFVVVVESFQRPAYLNNTVIMD